MQSRLDTLLQTLAQKHAPSVLQRAPSDDTRRRYLAQELAKNGVLVLPLTISTAHQVRQNDLVNEIVSLYGSFYRLLTDTLFPSLKSISANYADTTSPPILVIEAHCLPVIECFANYIVPYIAANYQQRSLNVAELQGVLNFVLEDLEGMTVPQETYRDLLKRGADYLTKLVSLPVQQHSLTLFARQHFLQIAPEPPEIATTIAPPPPETPRLRADAPPPPPEKPKAPSTPFVSAIPIIFDMRDKDDRPKNLPPVLPLKGSTQ